MTSCDHVIMHEPAYACCSLVATHLDIFHDDIDVSGRLDDFVQADDVWVHKKPQDLDFTAHCVHASPEQTS